MCDLVLDPVLASHLHLLDGLPPLGDRLTDAGRDAPLLVLFRTG
jgi:hypothetical protein